MNKYNEPPPVSMGNWMITLIVLALPIVNIIMLFYWAFTSSTNPSKRTYCQAMLMFGLIAVGIVAVAAIVNAISK